jgi:hypothetical protein
MLRSTFAVLIALALLAPELRPSAAVASPPVGPGEAGGIAAAADGIEVSVTVVHARPADGGVAPELAKLEKYLLKSFPNYKSFTRLSTRNDRLAVGAEARFSLPNGTELAFRNDGWKDGFAQLHLEVGGLKTTVNVKDGGLFFQAGRAFDGGMIVLAFDVKSAQ